MKYPGNLFIISMAVFGAYFARGAIAAQNAPTAFSTYGLIQPVNKYSSNPFWNTDSPYNQRMPVPVYATGADLNTGDCNRVVETLVATYCASHNYCTDSRINDIRPTVMVQLSQLPGHNFATSCGGYIDSVFENYQKTYGNMSAGTVQYTTAPTVQQTNTAQYKNPLQQKPNAYQTGVAERAAELERLQRATTASPELGPTDFPKTTADLSFTDRLANTTAGYEPYKDLNPYKTPQFESDEEFYERLKKLNPTEYCKHFPTDVETCSKKIHYELFGGTNAAHNPKYYIPGQGATISGIPTRSNSVFVAWCTDSALLNCARAQVIDKNENTDKVFFAKWGCTNGYVLQNNMCINPAAPNTDPYINPNPNNCPDVAHMDANCQCTVVPGTSIDPSTGMCKCDNGKDINSNCADGTPPVPADGKTYALLQCRVKPGRLQDSIYLGKNKSITDPAKALECADTPTQVATIGYRAIKNIDKCFTACGQWSTATGIVNTTLESILGQSFCSGNHWKSDPASIWNDIETDHVWFLSSFSGSGTLQPMELTKAQADAAISALQNAQASTEDVCTSDKRLWIIYVLEKTSDGKWLAIKNITIGGKNQ
jgi:hypothetical protein